MALAVLLLGMFGEPRPAGSRAEPIRTAHTPMPRHDYQRWRLVFADDFTGHRLRPAWSVYGPTKVPSNPTTAYWSPDHAQVAHGRLTLIASRDHAQGRIVSAGLGLWRMRPLRYGKVKMLVRVAECPEVKYAWLLWPYDGKWPDGGEIDFAEDEGGDRARTTASVLYADRHGNAATLPQNRIVPGRQFSRWHVVGVEWRPHSIKYTLDGHKWGVRRSTSVPQDRMVLALQTESLVAAPAVPRSFTSCNAQIGWVAEWAPR